MFSYLILVVLIFTLAFAQVFFKKGVSSFGDLKFSLKNVFSLIPNILKNGWMLIGMFFFGISFLIYLFVLSKFQLNTAYPIMVSSGIIIISLISRFWLKETLSRIQILGIVSIIAGIFLLAINS